MEGIIYSFNIDTNHDINDNNEIIVTNAVYYDNVTRTASIPLSHTWSILHTTTQISTEYTPSDLDVKYELYTALTGASNAREKISTHEHIDLTLGLVLSNLWSRSRTLAGDLSYAKYTEDVPLVAESTVYMKNADNTDFTITDGVLVMNPVLFNIGGNMTNADGSIIYKHRK